MKNAQSIYSPNWPIRIVILLGLSILANQVTNEDYFPLSESYEFPIVDILISFCTSVLFVFLADRNFKYYCDNYFNESVSHANIGYFIVTTLTYVVVISLIGYLVSIFLLEEEFEIFLFLVSLIVNILLYLIGIFILYSSPIWTLHKQATTEGKLTVRKSGKTIPISYAELSYLYSQEKVVYAVASDGKAIITDFTLNEVEGQLNIAGFFHANRQTILHKRSIITIESIANGKVSVIIQPGILGQDQMEIVVSRYKKQAFMNWFENIG